MAMKLLKRLSEMTEGVEGDEHASATAEGADDVHRPIFSGPSIPTVAGNSIMEPHNEITPKREMGVVGGVAGAIASAVAAPEGSSLSPTSAENECLRTKAEAAAVVFLEAAKAAELLAPLLPEALRRAEKAEAEVARLRHVIADAETKIEGMQAQQLRLTEGFLGELRHRDHELAILRAEAKRAPQTSPQESPRSSPSPAARTRRRISSKDRKRSTSKECTPQGDEEQVDALSFTMPGVLGVEFDRSNLVMKIVNSIKPGSATAGHLFAGDEVISISGEHARNLTWEELEAALALRPVVLSVRRGHGFAAWQEEAAASNSGRIFGRVRNFAGWTRNAARAATNEVERVISDMADLDSPESMPMVSVSSFLDDTDGRLAPSTLDADDDVEARNRPFYDLVRSAMVEACSAEPPSEDSRENVVDMDVRFECWLRQFHNERDDGWYENNHTRVYNAFRPHWDKVVAETSARVAVAEAAKQGRENAVPASGAPLRPMAAIV